MMDTKTHDGAEDARGFGFDPHHITAAELASLGMEEIAFVKPVTTPEGPAFGIFAADGTPMAIATGAELARAAIIQHEMVPAAVH